MDMKMIDRVLIVWLGLSCWVNVEHTIFDGRHF